MEEIKELLRITKKLEKDYGRKFTLDGKLVGDIGEVLAKEKYGLELYPENAPLHDGEEISTGKKVQIKSSFKGQSTFPYGKLKMPDYFLSINIDQNGEIEELYNGPGQFLFDVYVSGLKSKNKNFYTLAGGRLKHFNKLVDPKDKIKTVQ